MAGVVNLIRNRRHLRRRVEFTQPYKVLFRFSEAHVEWIVEHVMGGEHGENRGGALTTKERLQGLLRYVGDPGFQTGVGEDLGHRQSTACRSIHWCIDKLVEVSPQWIKFPHTCDQKREASESWMQQGKTFPQAIGAIDCTHIQILRPRQRHYPDEYVNRKGQFSVNVQATCDTDEKFTSVSAEWAGSVHDSRILRNSFIPAEMTPHQENYVLLGDCGYPITPWLMTPYRNPQTQQEITFNQVLTKERVIIERCFGQLKRRFPILSSKVRIDTHRVPRLIIACVTLHNIAKYLQDDDPEEDIIIAEEHHDLPEGNIRDANILQVRQNGQAKRRAISEMLMLNN